MILDLYRLGSLHVTDTGCALVMQTNIQYWAIDELLIESCCSLKYYPQLDVCQNEKSGDIEAKKMTEEKMKEENFGTSKFGRFRSWLWDTIGKGKVKTHREDFTLLFNGQIDYVSLCLFRISLDQQYCTTIRKDIVCCN